MRAEFRKYFDMFDKEKNGYIQASQVGQILRTGLSDFLRDAIGRTNQLGAEITEAYHF